MRMMSEWTEQIEAARQKKFGRVDDEDRAELERRIADRAEESLRGTAVPANEQAAFEQAGKALEDARLDVLHPRS
jgi:hypothetical protein